MPNLSRTRGGYSACRKVKTSKAASLVDAYAEKAGSMSGGMCTKPLGMLMMTGAAGADWR